MIKKFKEWCKQESKLNRFLSMGAPEGEEDHVTNGQLLLLVFAAPVLYVLPGLLSYLIEK